LVNWLLQHLGHRAEDARMKTDGVELWRVEREVIARVKHRLALEHRPFGCRVVSEDARLLLVQWMNGTRSLACCRHQVVWPDPVME
jgi:hypothetical protein